MIEKPKFWRWARLAVDRDTCQVFLQSSRVHIVQEIKIFGDVDNSLDNRILRILDILLAAVLDGRSQLKRLEVTDCGSKLDFPSLDPILLSQALVRLEEFNYRSCIPLSTAQLVAVFTAIE